VANRLKLHRQRAVGFIDLLDAGVLCNKVRRVRDDTANGTQVRETGAKLFLELQIQLSKGRRVLVDAAWCYEAQDWSSVILSCSV